MNRVALITGVTGFIGGELARRLIKDNWSVAIVVREGSDLSSIADISAASTTYRYDGTTESLTSILDEAKPDVVFHLASLFLADHVPSQVTDLIGSNVLFGAQLLEAMVACGVRNIVSAGTSWQNFHSDSYRAVNLYAATKQAFEDILGFYVDRYALSSVVLKLFDTYGAADKRRKLITLIVDAVKNAQELGVSPGEQVIDISHIDDVVEHFLRAGEFSIARELPKSHVFFVSGERFTVKELVKAIESAADTKASIVYGARPYREREVMYLPAVDGKTPPWDSLVSKISLRQGVQALLNS
ncbi:NAD(P)-dependent oxidoreductase [Pseudomonas extremaustralis]|uniref:NAD-dependent epimerase/dehydratase family protein n=1 Tax=Pseudomonas extremaustralis TaxID=359110 RepID=UPI00285A62F2|nr:NAD(P)-dependent oxidoreductase [Pseudomonas extremaustralis]MDR6578434.1 nucleoside-diphosphate-sugar epimerase [Pseudomonas extremaustralis]